MAKAFAAPEAGAKFEEIQFEVGELGKDEVEINVEHCGICHSDLSMLNNEWGFTQYPFVGGHEAVGTVAAVGDDVKTLQVGQKVGLGWHSGYCMTCNQCMSGDHNLCASGEASIGGRFGGFADKVKAKEAAVVPLPENIDVVSAGPLFCGGITVFNPMVQFDVQPTDKVGVIGIGGLGHMALMFLNAWGCEVTAFTSSDSKKEEAIKMGAHNVINSRSEEELQSVAGKFDYIISTVNVKLNWDAYISTLAPKGRFHFVGATVEPLDISLFPLLMGQRSISASPVGSPVNIAKMLDFAVHHDVKPVIEQYSFNDINDAFERLESGNARYRIVLSW